MTTAVERNSSIDLSRYNPLEWDEVKFIESAVPKREFPCGTKANWVASLTPRGVIIINIVHQGYPDAVCQIQLSPDAEGSQNVFFQHVSPSKKYIPDELAENLLFEIVEELEKQSPRSA